MKKTVIKGCVFAATFIVVLIVSSLFLNRGNTDMTAEMKLPELPLVYVNAVSYTHLGGWIWWLRICS